MSFYQITKSDGTTFNVYYLEENGPGNLSQPRSILAVNLTGGAGSNNFTLYGDLTYRFVSGFSFNVINSNGNNGTYTVGTGSYSTSSGYQIVNVGGAATGTTATGLVGTTTYTATIAVDGGAAQTITVLGSNATTFADLVTQINGQLTGALVFLVGGNLRVTSNTTGVTSTIAITDGTTPLFGSLTGYVAIDTAVAGVTTTGNTIIVVTTAIPGTVLPFGDIQYSIPTAEIATSLLLPGRGIQNYGNIILSDIVQVMENFANTTAPSYPIEGQQWFDTTTQTMNVYSGGSWTPISSGIQLTATTTDATTTAMTPTVASDMTFASVSTFGVFTFDIVGINTISTTPASSIVYSANLKVSVQLDSAGNYAIIGSPIVTVIADPSTSGWTVGATVTTNVVEIIVTGAAATNISWTAKGTKMYGS